MGRNQAPAKSGKTRHRFPARCAGVRRSPGRYGIFASYRRGSLANDRGHRRTIGHCDLDLARRTVSDYFGEKGTRCRSKGLSSDIRLIRSASLLLAAKIIRTGPPSTARRSQSWKPISPLIPTVRPGRPPKPGCAFLQDLMCAWSRKQPDGDGGCWAIDRCRLIGPKP
jgi:hypothetical protein